MKIKVNSGFTLVELLVTISIIVILATVAIVMYSAAEQSGRDGKRIADVQEIQKALEQYYTLNRGYPATHQNTDPINNIQGASFSAALNPYFGAGRAPSDPDLHNNDINFQYTLYTCGGDYQTGAKATRYIVCAYVEDCGGKCTKDTWPGADQNFGCNGSPNDGATPTGDGAYCLGSVSN